MKIRNRSARSGKMPALAWRSGSLFFRGAGWGVVLFFSAWATPGFGVDLVGDAKGPAKIFVEADETTDAPTSLAATSTPKPKPQTAPKAPGIFALALDDLVEHIERMTGVRLEVVRTSDPQLVVGPSLVLGALAKRLGCDVPPTPWKEGYRILAQGERVLIAGESPRGTSHGIYAFLRTLGCDWVMPGKLGEIIPEKKVLAVPDMDQSHAPDFPMRNFWYRGESFIVTKEERAEYAQWVRRQGLGKAEAFADNQEGHYWDTLISQNKKAFEADPKMLALVRLPDGTLVRQGPQVETANPKVIVLFAEALRKIFQTKRWPNDKAVTLAIGPADGDGFSVSPESLALDAHPQMCEPMMGGRDVTDLVVKLANDILDQAGQEFPRLTLGYYIYSVHSGFPSRYRPSPRIFPVFAPIGYSRLHSTTDPHSKSRAYYRHLVEQWAALSKAQGNQLQVYEYNWNLADNMLPFTRVKMMGEDIPFYHQRNFVGFTLESTKAWAINGPHDYLAARLVWDSSQDWKVLLKEYCLKTFGAAAPGMERYYLRLAETQSRAGQEAGSYYSAPLVFAEAEIRAAQGDLDDALSRNLSPEERLRTEAAALPLETLREYLAWHRAMNAFEFSKAQGALDAILAGWQKQYDRNTQFVARETPRYLNGLLRPSTAAALKYASAPYEIVWKFPDVLPTALDPSGGGEGDASSASDARRTKGASSPPRASAETARRYSEAPYRVVWKFPDALPTAFDPSGLGEFMNLASAEIQDRDWVRTSISTDDWASQGLGAYRDGAVWYRARFELPELPNEGEKSALGLFLGGFDGEVRVWVNGKRVERRGGPAVFDLTGAVHREGENLIALQVLRRASPNGGRRGGVFQPCFVFAGPKAPLEDKSPDPVTLSAPLSSSVSAPAKNEFDLAAPQLDESGWIRTRTRSSTWDAQGLGFYREGTVWYRVRFELTKEAAGKPLGLFLGGFEDEARVWVNGKSLGSSGVKFAQPAVFDLTDAVRGAEENVIAIQIVRNSRLNEIFIGGIFRPCFVFSGPRVAPAEKKGEPEYRILPGGEKERLAPPKG
ncbi:MAG: DUF4838 domain-containing protein [Verrucomicrobiae bacterium]|nr:DUF4838 domain-containing protein [Verrucomicrobiae bacterium]